MIASGVVLLLVYGAITTSIASQGSQISELHRIRRQTPDGEKAGCRLPQPLQNGKISPSKRRCPPDNDITLCQMTPGNLVPHNWPLYHSCDPGFILNTSAPASVCLDGQWKPALPSCIRYCPPLKPSKLRLKCDLGGQEVTCEREARPGTVATAVCPSYYRYNLDIKCQDDGTWADGRSNHTKTQMFPRSSNNTDLRCVPECGLSSKVENNGSTTNTVASSASEYPWIAVIYGKKKEKYEAMCVGTLISTRYVLTAAHHIYQYLQNSTQEEIRVGLGKTHREFYMVESSSVILEVDKIVIHESYDNKTFIMDIALLRFLVEVHASASVQPICMDWSHIYTPKSYTTLTVSGWSVTGNREIVTPGKVRYVRYEDCFTVLESKATRQMNLTSERSCAEDIDGNLYSGISGDTTSLEVDGRHFLVGFLASSIRIALGRRKMLILDVTNANISTWLERNMREDYTGERPL